MLSHPSFSSSTTCLFCDEPPLSYFLTQPPRFRRGAKVLSHFQPAYRPSLSLLPTALSLVQESTSRIVIVIRAINPCFKRKGKKNWTLFDRVDAFRKFIDERRGATNYNAPAPTTFMEQRCFQLIRVPLPLRFTRPG